MPHLEALDPSVAFVASITPFEALVPLVAIICIFGLPIGGWIALRYFQHKERMEMIRRGISPGTPNAGGKWVAGPPPPAAGTPPASGYFVPNMAAQDQLRRGIMTTFIGVALFIGLSFIGFHDGEGGGWEPGPWLLGGLIPTFVGLAQIVSAVLAGAELPGGRRVTTMHAPPPTPPQPPPPANGPYTYRPPGNQEELPRTKPPQQT